MEDSERCKRPDLKPELALQSWPALRHTHTGTGLPPLGGRGPSPASLPQNLVRTHFSPFSASCGLAHTRSLWKLATVGEREQSRYHFLKPTVPRTLHNAQIPQCPWGLDCSIPAGSRIPACSDPRQSMAQWLPRTLPLPHLDIKSGLGNLSYPMPWAYCVSSCHIAG